MDSILDETEDIVEGVTTGVGQIADTLDVTQLDELTETVCETTMTYKIKRISVTRKMMSVYEAFLVLSLMPY